LPSAMLEQELSVGDALWALGGKREVDATSIRIPSSHGIDSLLFPFGVGRRGRFVCVGAGTLPRMHAKCWRPSSGPQFGSTSAGLARRSTSTMQSVPHRQARPLGRGVGLWRRSTWYRRRRGIGPSINKGVVMRPSLAIPLSLCFLRLGQRQRVMAMLGRVARSEAQKAATAQRCACKPGQAAGPREGGGISRP
jgi:hypothetical protein